MITEVDLLESVVVIRIPPEVFVVPGHPHPGVNRQDGATLVDVEVDDGHAELDNDGLFWYKMLINIIGKPGSVVVKGDSLVI